MQMMIGTGASLTGPYKLLSRNARVYTYMGRKPMR